MSGLPWGDTNQKDNFDNSNTQFLSGAQSHAGQHYPHGAFPPSTFHPGSGHNSTWSSHQNNNLLSDVLAPQNNDCQSVNHFNFGPMAESNGPVSVSYNQATAGEYGNSYDHNYFGNSYIQGLPENIDDSQYIQHQGPYYQGPSFANDYHHYYNVQDSFLNKPPPISQQLQSPSDPSVAQEGNNNAEDVSLIENIAVGEENAIELLSNESFGEETAGIEMLLQSSDQQPQLLAAVPQAVSSNIGQTPPILDASLPPIGTMTGIPTGNQFRKAPSKKFAYFAKTGENLPGYSGNVESFTPDSNLLSSGLGDHSDMVADSSSIATEESIDQKLADNEVALYNQACSSPATNLDSAYNKLSSEQAQSLVDAALDDCPGDKDVKVCDAEAKKEEARSPPDVIKSNPWSQTDSSDMFNPLHYLMRKKPHRDSAMSPATTLWENLDVSPLKLGPKLVPAPEVEVLSGPEDGSVAKSAVSLPQNTGTGPSKNNLTLASESSAQSADRPVVPLVVPDNFGQDLIASLPLLSSPPVTHASAFQIVGDKAENVSTFSPPREIATSDAAVHLPADARSVQQHEAQHHLEQQQLQEHQDYKIQAISLEQTPRQQPPQQQATQQRQQVAAEDNVPKHAAWSATSQISDPQHSAFTSVKPDVIFSNPPNQTAQSAAEVQRQPSVDKQPSNPTMPDIQHRPARMAAYSALNPEAPSVVERQPTDPPRQGERQSLPGYEGQKNVGNPGDEYPEGRSLSRQDQQGHAPERSVSQHNYFNDPPQRHRPPDMRPSSRSGTSRPCSRSEFPRDEFHDGGRQRYGENLQSSRTNLFGQPAGGYDPHPAGGYDPHGRSLSRHSTRDDRERAPSRNECYDVSRRTSTSTQSFDARRDRHDDDRFREGHPRQNDDQLSPRSAERYYSNESFKYPDHRSKQPEERQRYPDDRQRYPDDRSRYPDDRQRYTDDRSRYPDDRQRYPEDRQRYPDDRSQYPDDRQRYPDDRQRYPDDRQRYPDDRQRYPDDRQRYPDDRQRYPDERSRYPDERSRYPDQDWSVHHDKHSRHLDERSREMYDSYNRPHSRQGYPNEGQYKARARDEYPSKSYREAYDRPRSRQDDPYHAPYDWMSSDWRNQEKYNEYWRHYNAMSYYYGQPGMPMDPYYATLYGYDPYNRGFYEEMASYGQPVPDLSAHDLEAARTSSRASSRNFNSLASAADQFARESQGDSRPTSQLSGFVAGGYVEEKKRLTPFKHIRPHMKATFSASGQLIHMMLSNPVEGQPACVRILSLCDLESDEVKEMGKYPGPLVRGVDKREVLQFCREMSLKCRDNLDLIDRSSAQLVWDFLSLLVKQNGSTSGEDLAELLLQGTDSHSMYEKVDRATSLDDPDTMLSTGFDRSFVVQDQPVGGQSKELTVTQITNRFRELLLLGKKKDALDWAVKQNLWGHAFYLALKMEGKTIASIMTKFSNVSMKVNDPLQTLYQVMSGRRPTFFTTSEDRFSDWRLHLSMVASNPTSKPELDKKSIIILGDMLASQGLLHASHICYLIAQSTFGEYNKKSSKIVLIGSSHGLPFMQFATNVAIWATEIYEYALSLRSPNFTLTSLVVYKFLYMTRLLDLGMFEEALKYVEVIAQCIIRNPGAYSPVIIRYVAHLSTTLKMWDPQRNSAMHEEGEADQEPLWCVNLMRIVRMLDDGTINFPKGSTSPQICSTEASSEVGEILMSGQQHPAIEDPSTNQWLESGYQQYNQLQPTTNDMSNSHLMSQWSTNQQIGQQYLPNQQSFDGPALDNALPRPQEGYPNAHVPLFGADDKMQTMSMPQEAIPPPFLQPQHHPQFTIGTLEMGEIPEETAQDFFDHRPRHHHHHHHHQQHNQEHRRRSRDRTASTSSNASRRSSGGGSSTPGKVGDGPTFQFGVTPQVSNPTLMSGMNQPLGAHNSLASDQPRKKQPLPGDDLFGSDDHVIKKNNAPDDKNKGSFWGGLFSRWAKDRPKEVTLPDDKKLRYVWDSTKNVYVDTAPDHDGQDVQGLAPSPPKISGPANDGRTEGNMFSLGSRPRGARHQYVDVMGKSTKPATSVPNSLLSVMPKSASVPANIYVPTIPADAGQNDTTQHSQQPTETQQLQQQVGDQNHQQQFPNYPQQPSSQQLPNYPQQPSSQQLPSYPQQPSSQQLPNYPQQPSSQQPQHNWQQPPLIAEDSEAPAQQPPPQPTFYNPSHFQSAAQPASQRPSRFGQRRAC